MSNVVKRHDGSGFVKTKNCVHSFEITGAVTRTSSVNNSNPLVNTDAWDEKAITIGKVKLIPRGEKNNMPEETRNMLEKSNMAPPTINRNKNLLFGDGLMTYEMDYESGIPIRKYVEDNEIESWLDSFDATNYIDGVLTDYFSENKYSTMMKRNVGHHIGGSKFITELEHKMNLEVYPEWPDEKGRIRNIYIGSYTNFSVFNLKGYPAFDPKNPLKHPWSILYLNNYAYGRNKYSPPAYHGASNWIKVGSNVPLILLSLDDQMLTLKYHIKTPISYWDNKREDIKLQCVEKNIIFTESMLDDLKDEMFENIGDLLSGVDNAGKFLTSEYVVNNYGKLEGWEIESVDMKVKDFINAQLAIAKRSDLEIASGMGISPALSNLSMDGNMSSGSEQLYALKMHLGTDTALNEIKTLKALNTAKKVNFPNNKRMIGYFHKIIKKEEDITPGSRATNNA